jgi:hypothetical protein
VAGTGGVVPRLRLNAEILQSGTALFTVGAIVLCCRLWVTALVGGFAHASPASRDTRDESCSDWKKNVPGLFEEDCHLHISAFYEGQCVLEVSRRHRLYSGGYCRLRVMSYNNCRMFIRSDFVA